MHTPWPGPPLQLAHELGPAGRAQVENRAGIEHAQMKFGVEVEELRHAGPHLRHVAVEARAQRLHGHARLHPLDAAQVAGDEGHGRLVRGEQKGGGLGAGPDHERGVARLDPREDPGERARRIHSPVRRRALGLAQLDELPAPPAVGPERQPLHDQAVHRVQHEHFGEHELALGRGLQLGGRFVAEAQELVAADRVLVALDALEDVLVVVLPVGVRCPAPRLRLAQLRGGQHPTSAPAERGVRVRRIGRE